MSFTAPDLNTAAQTKSDINTNFTLIERALASIQNELPHISTSASATNYAWIDRALRPEGVIGPDCFTIAFNTDGDVFSIEHNDVSGYSSCVIANLYHETSADFTKAFSELCTTDGIFELAFGVQSKGAPVIEQLLVIDGTDVYLDLDLIVWRFNVTRSGTTYTVSNLRRVAPIILNLEAFRNVGEFQHPFTWTYPGSLPTVQGEFLTGVCVPWDCEVAGAFMRMGTTSDQTDGISIDIYTGTGTDAESVLLSPANWGPGDSGLVIECSPASPTKLLAAGSYIYPIITHAETIGVTDYGGPQPSAEDLSITVLLRAIYQPIW